MDFGNHLEHFSLRWNDFNDNMKSGLHDLLKTEDFVDVTIAAEGKLIQAHKMVLSVCSPYFKNIFKANPCQHPIVFLKDVTHKELSGILQFMYLGEVSIQQEELGRFLKTAEALQVKGLTGEDKDETEQENHKQHPVRNKTKLDSKDFNDKDSCSKKMKLSTINDLGKTSQVQNESETVLNSQNHNLSNFRKTVIQELELSDGGNDEKNFFKEESVSINEPFFQLEDNNLELEDKDDEESPTFSGPPQEYLGGNQELSNEPFAMSDVNQEIKFVMSPRMRPYLVFNNYLYIKDHIGLSSPGQTKTIYWRCKDISCKARCIQSDFKFRLKRNTYHRHSPNLDPSYFPLNLKKPYDVIHFLN